MTNELTDVRCPCGDEYPADSYDAGFIAGSGMCQNCDAALPPKDICTCPSGDGSLRHPCPAHPAVEQAGGDERAAFFKHLIGRHPAHETEIARVVEHNYAAWKAWQARAVLAQPSPAPVCTTPTGENCPGDGVKSCKKCPEQAEAERPDVVETAVLELEAAGWRNDDPKASVTSVSALLSRIVGELRFERQQMDRAFTACINERDAAQARVAELEKQEPVAHLRASDLERLNQPGIAGSAGSLWNGPREGFVPLYAAPVAQAQHSVPEGWKLVPMDKGCVTSSMKAECIGEFSFYIRAACAECLDVGTDSDCHVCGGDIEYDQKIDVPWDTCKEIYKAMLAAAPGKVVGHE
ncbi:hypothetical protein PX122_29890 [Pseudomonas aeruginosa]|uniref:hypothetical protein n=1 Tax=Pseudomonas aeruginosa TaxID=287 RepID=UPI000AFF319C|nr:hypothetical protein [Pseudomonas aeruginosa]ELV1373957.1 hypothetical protein [Pseudomonas aeruginosa]MCX3421617.1 hypothetical protein [Pseudomonas aeruginosa]TSC51430.1 hypothetical protein FNV45_00080 [Pseudomonas aeruginosa]HBN9216147.1 hypothetical protein [Pseudomonas aeruginosa]HBO3127276.1 hypothetical protein [Pseudomonas aeruginosa]